MRSPWGKQGITYLVVGGGGANLRAFAAARPSWSVIRDNKAHGYLDVDVTEGTLTAQLVTTSGGVLDSFTLKKQLPERPPVVVGGGEPTGPVTTAPAPGTSQPTDPGVSQPQNPEAPSSGVSNDEPSATGCATVPVGSFLPFGALALAGLRRRRRR